MRTVTRVLSSKTARLAALAAFICCASAFGQTVTATLVGTVLDQTGAAVPGAAITITHTGTNTGRSVAAGERGDYIVTHLRPGDYRISAEQTGFKRTVMENINLLVDQTARIDLVLELGQVTESVEVTGAALLVNSETSSLGQVIDQNQMLNLPLKGRGFYELALLAPGVTPKMPGSFVGNRRPTPGGLNAPAFYVAGARETSNGYLIDGVDAQDPHYLTPSIFPSVDAIQEFKLQTNAYSAEFGRFAAQVNATTRSGTNEYHGSVYHFFRNDALDAAGFFDNFTGTGKQPFRYNQFGATMGGPLSLPKLYDGTDRTFFFASYEGTRVRRGKTGQLNVPAAAQRAGDFSDLGNRGNQPVFDPATTRPNPAGAGVIRDPFPNNRIPDARITPFAKTVLGLYPLPMSEVSRGNNVFAPLSDNSDNNQLMFRFDHRLNSNNSVFFRYSIFDGSQSNKSAIDQAGDSTDVRTHNMAFNYIRVFTPTTLNEFRLGYNRPTYLILQDGAYEKDYATLLGIKNLLRDPIGWGVPNVTLAGFSGMGTDSNPTTQVSNVYQIVNHVSLVRGTHNIKVGAEGRKTNYNDRSERQVRGQFNFTGAFSANPRSRTNTGVSVADALLGLPLTATGTGTSLAGNFNGFSYGFFAQDDWKINSRVTLNWGLRYELNTRYTDVQNRLSFFDAAYPGGRLLIAGGSQAFIPGTGLVNATETSRGLVPADRNNFAPRIGLAFRPFADSRTAIRVGYGVFYNLIELQELRTWARNPPFGEIISLQSNQDGQASAPDVLRVSELFPAQGSPASRPNVFGPTPQAPDPYYQQWNFSIQRELPGRTLLELGYIGSKGTRLIQRINYNQASLDADPSRPTSILNRRPFPLFGNTIRIGDPSANSTYHGMIAKFERRLSSGFSFLTSYTWSKSLDESSLIDDMPRDIHNRALNKGRSRHDISQRAVISGTWDLPFGRGKAYWNNGSPMGLLFGGWQINSIMNFRTGFPFDVGVVGDVCNCGAAAQKAQQVGDPLNGFERGREKWFNTAAFATPARGSFGSSGRNILDGPGAINIDTSLFRTLAAGERTRIQLRAEFFNLFNNVNFSQPNSQVGNNSYGIIQGSEAARVIQFALKVRF